MPDPKLKIAMEEIKAVLKKHDVACVAVISSPTHQEFLLQPKASWSCAWIEGNQFRMKALLADFPDKAAQRRCVEATTGMIMGFITVLEQLLDNLKQMLAMLSNKFDIEHWDKFEG